MDLLQAIYTRRTIHKYTTNQVPFSVLEKGVEAAHQAPCHKLTWPWRFTLTGDLTRKAIAAAAIQVKEQNGPLTTEQKEQIHTKIHAPGALVVVSQIRASDPFRAKEDYAAVSCAVQNFLLAMTAEGLGSKWSTGAVTRSQATYTALKIDPTAEEIVGFLWVGAPQITPNVKRPPASEIMRRMP